jgi:hypothetical protein
VCVSAVLAQLAYQFEDSDCVTPNSRNEVRRLVLGEERLDGLVGLTALDLAELTPEERNNGHGLEPTAGDALVDVTTFGPHDSAESADGVLETDQDNRHSAAVSRLRNSHLQPQIAGPGFVRMHQRASFAIKETCGPCELGVVEDHCGRRVEHATSPFPLRIEQ